MDTDILIGNKDSLYDQDFLDHLSNEYQWSSLLDATDASPSQILADAAPNFDPVTSPILSIKSSPTESSNSDSGSEDDSKNSSSGTSERQSSQSPFDWMSSFDDEPPNNLNPEDVEQFLQKSVPISSPSQDELLSNNSPEKSGPVMAIENGVIKGVERDNDRYDQQSSPPSCKHNGKSYLQNAYFKVVNENHSTNTTSRDDDYKIVLNDQIQLFVERKKFPGILKRPTNLVVTTNPSSIMIPAESTNGRRIAISPFPQMNINGAKDTNGFQVKMSPPRSNIIINSESIMSTTIVQNGVIPVVNLENPENPDLDLSNLTEAEIKAVRKHQRMIKNRESASQSRQKKKEYVSTLEQQLLEAHQEITRLRLENKQLRDQLGTNGRSRKIPRLDAMLLKPKKNIAVIFAMIFMVSLNFKVLGWNSKPIVGPSVPHRSTRQLLWKEESAEVIPGYEQPMNRSTYGIDCQNMTMEANDSMNHTESIRIVGELKRWIGGGKTLNWTYDAPRKKRNVYLNEEKINGGLLNTYKLFNKLNLDSNLVDFPTTNKRSIKEKTRLRRLRRSKELDFAENAVYDYETLYHKPLRKSVDDFDMTDLGDWHALLEALQRRDDTFYVVGVGKGEHLLLPAVSHNVTRPPKMALILPAISGNDSLMNDHVTLMQIDCAIVNTSLFKLKSDALPSSVRKKSNHQVKVDSTKPENKISTYLSTPNKGIIDDNLTDVLKNSSNSVPNNPMFNAEHPPANSVDMVKDDVFAQYLISKYEESKNGSNSHVTNLRRNRNSKNKMKEVRTNNNKGTV